MHPPRRRSLRRATAGPWRTLVLAVAAVWCASFWPPPALGATPLPAESVTSLDGALEAAIVGDVDGDGMRELVRVVAWDTNPSQLAVEVISVAADGTVDNHGQVPLRRESVPDDREVVSGRPPDDQNMLPLAPGEPVRLIAWQQSGRERVLVATLGAARLAVPCCLTLWSVGFDAGGATTLELLGLTSNNADALITADLDADGTDELVLTEPDGSAHPGTELIRVLRYDGRRFVRVGDPQPAPPGTRFVNVGDTDGVPGAEVGAAYAPGVSGSDVTPAFVLRLSMPDGVTPMMEAAQAPFAGTPVGLVGPEGPRIAVASGSSGTFLLDWPAGGGATVVAQSLRRGVPLAVIGEGALARIVLLRDDDVLDVLDASLRPTQGLTGSVPAAPFLGSIRPPYVGVLPGGMPDGSPAVIYRGRLVMAPGAGVPNNQLRTSFVAVMPGMTPVGAFGPDGRWFALAGRAGVPTERDGGQLVFTAPSPQTRLTVTESATVLSAEANDGDLQPALNGAVFVAGQPARQVVMARADFDVVIGAPPDSLAFFETSDPSFGSGTRATSQGVATLHVSETGSENVRFSARLLVVTPAGHGYGTAWEVRIQRNPPSLQVSAVTPLLAGGCDDHREDRSGRWRDRWRAGRAGGRERLLPDDGWRGHLPERCGRCGHGPGGQHRPLPAQRGRAGRLPAVSLDPDRGRAHRAGRGVPVPARSSPAGGGARFRRVLLRGDRVGRCYSRAPLRPAVRTSRCPCNRPEPSPTWSRTSSARCARRNASWSLPASRSWPPRWWRS